MKTNDELNAAVARAMRWTWKDQPGYWTVWEGPDWHAGFLPDFSQSLDAFRTHVLPELERRGKMEAWARKVARRVEPAGRLHTPSVVRSHME